MSLPTTFRGFCTSFIRGLRLIDGGDLLNLLINTGADPRNSVKALAGGGQVGATQLRGGLSNVITVASDNDSVALPVAIPGVICQIINTGGHSLQVFGNISNPNNAGAGDTIAAHNSTAQTVTATGVAQPTANVGIYYCFATGQWKQTLMT